MEIFTYTLIGELNMNITTQICSITVIKKYRERESWDVFRWLRCWRPLLRRGDPQWAGGPHQLHCDLPGEPGLEPRPAGAWAERWLPQQDDLHHLRVSEDHSTDLSLMPNCPWCLIIIHNHCHHPYDDHHTVCLVLNVGCFSVWSVCMTECPPLLRSTPARPGSTVWAVKQQVPSPWGRCEEGLLSKFLVANSNSSNSCSSSVRNSVTQFGQNPVVTLLNWQD